MIKGLFKNLFTGRSDQERMYTFLSQATDQVHLEHLQREWDRMTYDKRRNW
jgi:hypothetical protein